jgi:hypothetical protein
VIIVGASLGYIIFLWWMGWHRLWNRRAFVKRRLLVEEEGQRLWRVVRARVLVGWPRNAGEINPQWLLGERTGSPWANSSWVVLQARRNVLAAYRVTARIDDQTVGEITLCRSWEELERAVPPKIFEEAALAAKRIKPVSYREVPLLRTGE